MKYLKIENLGLLEPKLIPLMGGTTKAKALMDKNEIKL